MSFEFGKANCSELYEIAELYAAASATPGCTWRSGYPGLETARADLEAASLYRLADEDGRVIAAASICIPDDLTEFIYPEVKRACEISRLCTHPSVQGLGVGGEMLDRMLEEAAALGFDGAVLLVAVGNIRARKLYGDRKFSETGNMHKYSLDFVFMQRTL